MSRPSLLLDIYRRGIAQLNDANDLELQRGRMFLDSLPSAVPIVADNVSQYLRNKGTFDPERDLPTLAPPFETFWIEYDHPAYLGTPGALRVGALFRSFPAEDYDVGAKNADSLFRTAFESSNQTPDTRTWTPIVDPVRWLLIVDVILRFDSSPPMGPIKTWMAAIRPDGMVAHCEIGLANTSMYYGPSSLLTPDYVNVSTRCLSAALLTISFLHCKNVAQRDNLPSRQERREIQRRGDPIITYKTLEIEPMRKVLATEGGIEKNVIKKALHICRGHFSNYSEEKPLFGKYVGQFWIPAHVRGSEDAGKVFKDYSVKSPKTA